ncbi:SIMPL domain-containing protein [Sphingomicrobium lutaoense]|uniref:SIMPL domain-containing protein n=1 Tax=Sphingomicrobium lutaoense TaxID=515949 RepID=A0A839YX92_9SPHN|nr:SIMPL domain-containing protein [Sphingomicrobium lutaoense]MBB3763100.1 hypothetical protein [Sphingomicrobium lutaoense]
MRKLNLVLAGIGALAPLLWTMPATAQGSPVVQTAPGTTRLELSVTGEAVRVPDIAIVSAGVQTRAATANGAISANRNRMAKVIDALKAAGVAERDMHTSSVSLSADYDYSEREAPRLTGYRASNMVTVRFHDIASTGKILDALVSAGANQINGPSLEIDDRAGALDEARLDALKKGQERAQLYARALGKNGARLVMVSEGGGGNMPPMPMAMRAESMDQAASTQILPGEQQVNMTLQMLFELQ